MASEYDDDGSEMGGLDVIEEEEDNDEREDQYDTPARFSEATTNTQLANDLYGVLINPSVPYEAIVAHQKQNATLNKNSPSRSRSRSGSVASSRRSASSTSSRHHHRHHNRKARSPSPPPKRRLIPKKKKQPKKGGGGGGRKRSRSRSESGSDSGSGSEEEEIYHRKSHSRSRTRSQGGLPSFQVYNPDLEQEERLNLITLYRRLDKQGYTRRLSEDDLETLSLQRLRHIVQGLKRERLCDLSTQDYKNYIVTGAGMVERVLPIVSDLFIPSPLHLQLHGLSQRVEGALLRGQFDDALDRLYLERSKHPQLPPSASIVIGILLIIAKTHIDNIGSGNIRTGISNIIGMFTGQGTMPLGINLFMSLFNQGSGGNSGGLAGLSGLAGLAGLGGAGGGNKEPAAAQASSQFSTNYGASSTPQSIPQSYETVDESAEALRQALNQLNDN